MAAESHEPRAHQRARMDLAADRHWVARDRLTGFLSNNPTDQPTLELLGEVCAAQRDLPSAGRYWYLTTREDDTAQAARSALEVRCGHRATNIISQITPRAPIDVWPHPVQERLRALQTKARTEGYRWEPRWRQGTPGAPRGAHESTAWRERAVENLVVGILLLLTIGVWALGLVTIGTWVVGLFA